MRESPRVEWPVWHGSVGAKICCCWDHRSLILFNPPIWAGTLTPTNSSTDIATYLISRVYGRAPTASELGEAIRSLDSDVQGTFLANLALTQANIAQVDLVGLSKTGFDYPLAG